MSYLFILLGSDIGKDEVSCEDVEGNSEILSWFSLEEIVDLVTKVPLFLEVGVKKEVILDFFCWNMWQGDC